MSARWVGGENKVYFSLDVDPISEEKSLLMHCGYNAKKSGLQPYPNQRHRLLEKVFTYHMYYENDVSRAELLEHWGEPQSTQRKQKILSMLWSFAFKGKNNPRMVDAVDAWRADYDWCNDTFQCVQYSGVYVGVDREHPEGSGMPVPSFDSIDLELLEEERMVSFPAPGVHVAPPPVPIPLPESYPQHLFSGAPMSHLLVPRMPMVYCPAGTFWMGAPEHDEEAKEWERPYHQVTLTKGFWMSVYPCTQGLYRAVMGHNPSCFQAGEETDMHPVENVSWFDALRFCNQLSRLDGLSPCYRFWTDEDGNNVELIKDGNGYRLPTEAQWEYAAKAQQPFLYAGSNDIDEVAWYSKNSDSKTHPVGQKKANGYGLYDMSGNVREWVWDSDYRKYDSSTIDPMYVDASSTARVYRGGGWYSNARNSRVSSHYGDDASDRDDCRGFRFLSRP